jgi:hypothetical protein
VLDDLADQGVSEQAGEEVPHGLVALDLAEECGELRRRGVWVVVGAADLGEQVSRVVPPELPGAQVEGAVADVEQVRIGVKVCGASATPGSVPARLSIAEMPAAVWVRDGPPPLTVLGSISAISSRNATPRPCRRWPSGCRPVLRGRRLPTRGRRPRHAAAQRLWAALEGS